jgi:uncharacterized membrane protein
MRALGLIIGLVLGGSTLGWGGAVLGAVAGLAIGWAVRVRRDALEAEARRDTRIAGVRARIEARHDLSGEARGMPLARSVADRLTSIESALSRVEARLDAIERHAGIATTASAPVRNDPDATAVTVPATGSTPGVVTEPRSVAPVAPAVPLVAEVAPTPAAGDTTQAAPSVEDRLAASIYGDADSGPGTRTEPPAARSATTVDRAYATSHAGPAPLPSFLSRLLSGNLVAKVGAVILFFGVGFLLKFAYERDLIPVWIRLASVATFGAALVLGGARLMATRRVYALILQGAGIGVLYLDTFFALRLYATLSPGIAFALFLGLGVACTLMAVRQDARALALLGLTGAFLAPPLASTGGGDHVLLFSYYALLNAFIVAVAWFKSWRELNLAGFVFTFVVSLLWGDAYYQPALFGSVEPFVLLFFAMYVVIPVLFASRQPPELRGLVDGTLVFGVPAAFAFLQARLVADLPDGLAWSAAGAALSYGVLALSMWRRAAMRVLAEAYAALGVVLATLSVFFAFDAYPTFALWTLEGAAIVWIGIRQQRILPRLFGIGLQFGAALYFLAHHGEMAGLHPVFNAFVIGCGLITVASLLTGWLLHRAADTVLPVEGAAGGALLFWGTGWWLLGGAHAIGHTFVDEAFVPLVVLHGTVAALLAELVGQRLAWPGLRLTHTVHALLLVLGTGATFLDVMGHPLTQEGAFAWPVAFAAYYWILHRQGADGLVALHAFRYVLGWCLMTVLATWEAVWRFGNGDYRFLMALGAVGAVVAWMRYRLRERDQPGAAPASPWVLAWAAGCWFAGGLAEVDTQAGGPDRAPASLAFVALSCLAFELAASRLVWDALRRAQPLLIVALGVAAAAQWFEHRAPLSGTALVAWIAAAAVQYWLLHRRGDDANTPSTAIQHPLTLWLLVAVAASDLALRAATAGLGSGWEVAPWGLVPALALAGVAIAARRGLWPAAAHSTLYLSTTAWPIVAALLLWTIRVNIAHPGTGTPWPHVPLFNPVDLAQAAVLAALVSWHRAVRADGSVPGGLFPVPALAAALGFLWANGIVLRAAHHWAGVPFTLPALLDSFLVQASLALLWSATALVLMLLATRRGIRTQWFVGAALLACVVAKLFLVDLSGTGTVARIVSFIGVGLLLLAIGYVAPVPPSPQDPGADT